VSKYLEQVKPICCKITKCLHYNKLTIVYVYITYVIMDAVFFILVNISNWDVEVICSKFSSEKAILNLSKFAFDVEHICFLDVINLLLVVKALDV